MAILKHQYLDRIYFFSMIGIKIINHSKQTFGLKKKVKIIELLQFVYKIFKIINI